LNLSHKISNRSPKKPNKFARKKLAGAITQNGWRVAANDLGAEYRRHLIESDRDWKLLRGSSEEAGADS
jgi:hypothetical protein